MNDLKDGWMDGWMDGWISELPFFVSDLFTERSLC